MGDQESDQQCEFCQEKFEDQNILDKHTAFTHPESYLQRKFGCIGNVSVFAVQKTGKLVRSTSNKSLEVEEIIEIEDAKPKVTRSLKGKQKTVSTLVHSVSPNFSELDPICVVKQENGKKENTHNNTKLETDNYG